MADRLEQRIHAAAEARLAHHQFVAPVDVLASIGWLRPEHAEDWRRDRLPYLERAATANLSKLSFETSLASEHPGATGGFSFKDDPHAKNRPMSIVRVSMRSPTGLPACEYTSNAGSLQTPPKILAGTPHEVKCPPGFSSLSSGR